MVRLTFGNVAIHAVDNDADFGRCHLYGRFNGDRGQFRSGGRCSGGWFGSCRSRLSFCRLERYFRFRFFRFRTFIRVVREVVLLLFAREAHGEKWTRKRAAPRLI